MDYFLVNNGVKNIITFLIFFFSLLSLQSRGLTTFKKYYIYYEFLIPFKDVFNELNHEYSSFRRALVILDDDQKSHISRKKCQR